MIPTLGLVYLLHMFVSEKGDQSKRINPQSSILGLLILNVFSVKW